MRKIRIAQIGFNRNSHAMPVFMRLKRLECFEVAGYVLPEGEWEWLSDLQKSRLADCRQLTLEQVLNDPTIEAVTIETEEVNLTRYALMAAKAGKHIHMEKPGGIALADFEELIAIMKKTGKVFHTGYMYRYNPLIRQTMEQVKKGELGEIISVEAQMNCPHTPEVRQWLENFPGGMMFFLGCHLVDLVVQLQGLPKRVIPLNKSTDTDGVTAEDFSMAVLEYDRGYSFVKTVACEKGGFRRRQLVITGTKKTVEMKPLEIVEGPSHHTIMTTYDTMDWHDPGETVDSGLFDRYAPMLEGFGKMVAGEQENPWNYDYELDLYRLILQCCGRSSDVSK